MAYTVYLSSTLRDLGAERKAVREALSGKCVVKQSYDASETSLIQSCLEDVGECDLYLLIVGLRYGHIPHHEVANPKNLSITELEYRQAVEKNISRLVFLKSEEEITVADSDSHTKEHDPKLIEEFRRQVSDGRDQRPAVFGKPEDLRYKVAEAFNALKARREGKSGGLFGSPAKHPAELTTDLVILCAAGTDNAVKEAINAQRDARFRADEVSPDDTQYLLSLDRRIRSARAAGFLVTRASLPRVTAKPGLMEAGLSAATRRLGRAFVLLDGPAEADLPASWLQVPGCTVVRLEPGDLRLRTAESLAQAYLKVRERTPAIVNDRRVGVPCLVIALTLPEAQDLVKDSGSIFGRFKPAQGAARKGQFDAFQDALHRSRLSWPEQFYGDRAEDWKPFGPAGLTSRALLDKAIDRVNADQRPGSRERRFLRDYHLQPQHYSFEDYRQDALGSRAMMEDVRDRGCLVFIDELALLHPDLRDHVDSFVSDPRVAVVSANPCDPAHLSTNDLLDDFSHLRVGSLFARFRDQQDPRCELSLNSQARLERWLRLVLPELVSTLGYEESQPELLANSDTLLI